MSDSSPVPAGSINDPIPLLVPGDRSTLLGARRGNQLIKICNAVKGIKADPASGLKVILSDDGILLDATQVGAGNSSPQILLVQVTQVNNGTLTCEDVNGATYTVAMPTELQSQFYTSQTFQDQYGIHTYAFVNNQQRTDTLTNGQPLQSYITPPYGLGDVLFVCQPSGGTAFSNVTYQDLNIAGRQWQAYLITSGCDETGAVMNLQQGNAFPQPVS